MKKLIFSIVVLLSILIWGIATAAEVDASNILIASLRAMVRAVAKLTHTPDYILVDGNRLPD